MIIQKTCIGECRLEKELNCFSKGRSECKECTAKYHKDYYINNKEKVSKQTKEYRISNKEKRSENSKIYRTNNKNKIENYNKEYNKDNKDKIKEYNKEYNKYNKEKRSENSKIYRKEKWKADPLYRLRKTVSGAIRLALKRNNSSKAGQSCLKFLPYSIQELKTHIESKFEPWMNWNNQGVYKVSDWNDNDQSTWLWNIDHIIPHSTFNYISMEDQSFKDCWKLSNLRPLSAKQNILDGTSRIRHI